MLNEKVSWSDSRESVGAICDSPKFKMDAVGQFELYVEWFGTDIAA